MRSLLAVLALTTLALAPRVADAVKLRRPFDPAIGVNYGYDNNGGGSGCTDYQCGGVCYDTHTGTDFPLSVGTAVRAGADGTVSATYNGCSDWGYAGNSCGGYCGNYVQLTHADGSRTIYCHMKLNTVAVSNGQAVSCGQYLGQSASSGSSTGPHLHFGLTVGGYKRDPFEGACSHSGSYWVSQGSYPHPIPSAQCETVCECSVGATQSRACCDCGTQTRTCAGNCTWGPWSGCDGPDPGGGNQVCDTGELGVCADGRRRCLDGCLGCVRVNAPSSETCDDADNDCDGAVDEDAPQEVGSPPPAWAARMVDASWPSSLVPGESAAGWVVFENVGRETWWSGDLWLALVGREQSAIYDPSSWPAYDVLSLIGVDVRPGERVRLPFSLLAGDAAVGALSEQFHLFDPGGEPLRCPSPGLEITIMSQQSAGAPDAPNPGSTSDLAGGCAVATWAGRRQPSLPAFVLLTFVIGLLGRPKRRCRPQGGREP